MREVNGLLFIGDPHLSSRKPGRRKDDDFPAVVLGKIEHLVEVANRERYLPVFLGDMYDSPVEADEEVKTRLTRVLKKSWTVPVCNVGNHDIRNAVLTDGDSLAYLAESGVVRACARSGPVETVTMGGKKVGLGATPYGQSFPLDARPHFPDVDAVVWITHHDIAFADPYPGSAAPQAIAGCKLVVNGHMHLAKPFVKVGGTVWFNPGNITRQAIDAIDHEPAAWVLLASGALEKVGIPHEKAVFDLTGKLVSAISPGEDPRKSEGRDSEFVSLLQADDSMDMDRSDDGSILMEEISAKFAADGTEPDVRSVIESLHREAVTGRREL